MAGFGQRDIGNFSGRDLAALLCQPDGIPSLAIGYRQDPRISAPNRAACEARKRLGAVPKR